MRNKIFLLFFLSIFSLKAEIYYVSPDGDNKNDGKSIQSAWKTPDRGMPTYLREDTKQGDNIIYVARATQFPEKGKVKIGDTIVEYEGRTADSLLNCKGTPQAKKGTKVVLLDWDCIKPGDKVIILEGLYTLKEKFSKDNKEWAGGNNGVFAITVSGNEENPIVIEGKDKAIIDGNWEQRSIFIRGNNIIIKNLEIRKGGILCVFSKNVEITQNKIHYGIHSIYVRYSENIKITKNLIYDFHGAWTESGISIGDSKNIEILNNTIVNCGTGIRIWGNTKQANIKRNIISWCGTGIVREGNAEIKKENIKENLLWANGKVIWMHNLGKEGKNEGINYYKGIDFQPEDLYQDPKIVSWYSDSPNFLSPHISSICFSEGREIGAKEPSDYERRYDYKEGENIIFNGSFEFGFYGWRGKSWWSFNEGEAKWEIKNEGYHGEKCLFIEEAPKGKHRSAPSVFSVYFPVNRGTTYTISFYAKGKGRLGVGFAIPSWHDGSSFGEKINLTDQWQNYKVKIKLPDFVSDWVAVKFSADYSSAYIDKVMVYEGEKERDYPDIEIFYKENENGLLPPDESIPLVIKNYSGKKNLIVDWEILSPYGKEIEKGTFKIGEEKKKNLRIKNIEGIYLFKYDVKEQGNVISKGYFRFVIGNPIGKTKNRDFIAATPPYKNYPSLNDFEKMVKKLSSYGIGTFHLYTGIERMKEFIEEDYFEKMVSITKKYDINWLITLDDGKLFTGKRPFVPAPGNVEGDFPEIKTEGGRVTEEQLNVWEKYVSELVKKFKGKIKYYEICNEPNCYVSGEEYVKIFTKTAPLIKEIDKNSEIIAGSVVNAFRKDLYNKTLELPPSSFDWFSFHPYRFGITNPEIQGSIREHIRMVKEDMRKNGHKEKIWLTEEGMGPGFERTRCIGSIFSHSISLYTPLFSEDEILWTNFAMRMYLTAFGEGCGGYNYHTLPVLFIDGNTTPSLLLKALHTMASLLGNSSLVDFFEIENKYVGYIFKDDERITVVLWNKDCEWGENIELSVPFEIKIYGMFGERKEIEKKKSEWEFILDRNINYLVFEELHENKIKEIINNWNFIIKYLKR